MKLRTLLLSILVLSNLWAVAAKAQVQDIFTPDLTGTTTPAGYTQVNANGGSTSYPGDGTMTSGDLSIGGVQSYITSTLSNPMAASSSYTIQATFTPSYLYTGSPNTQVDIQLLTLKTTGGNDNLFTLGLQFNTYGSTDSRITTSSGVEYGVGTSGSNTYDTFAGVNGIDFNTYTLNDTLTFSNDFVGGTATVTNLGTLTEDGTIVYTFNNTNTGQVYNGDSFEPATNPLSFKVGVVNSNLPDGFFDSGASVTLSDISITSAPEPSTYALLGIGLVLLVGVQSVRRKTVTS